jgi:hypothetical protein
MMGRNQPGTIIPTSDWILRSGEWDDTGLWDDNEIWID